MFVFLGIFRFRNVSGMHFFSTVQYTKRNTFSFRHNNSSAWINFCAKPGGAGKGEGGCSPVLLPVILQQADSGKCFTGRLCFLLPF